MLKPYSRAELQFEKIKEIGIDGKNSKAFICLDHQLNAQIVIKEMPKKDFDSLADFFEESKCLYASAHPNVVQIHYACEDSDNIYIAMPYYKNGSIKTILSARNMTIREIVIVGCQVLTGIHNIHSKKLIHFDIKPDNILLSDRGEALVADFGQSKQTDILGKAAQDRLYARMTPPEAMSTDKFSYTFDIYQFGLTLYRMCVGSAPFEAQFSAFIKAGTLDRESFRYAVRNGKFPDRSAMPPHAPAALKKIIKRCLEPEPNDRFQSAIEVANELAKIDGEHLDWEYSLTVDQRIWRKNIDAISYEFIVEKDGKSTCYKTVGGGDRKRVTNACRNSVTERDIGTILGSY
jgi:serine/threonine protein kinase